jgi:hypothetical protein
MRRKKSAAPMQTELVRARKKELKQLSFSVELFDASFHT